MRKYRLTIEDGRYEMGGGYGCWALSRDKNVARGDVRVIAGVLMKVYTIRKRRFTAPYVRWIPVDEEYNNYDNLKKFRASIVR